jgi:16S rRNA (guanine1207-N2)-methyltransferase
LFAWDRIDAGTALLLQHLPATLAGRVADLGAGWGALARGVLACAGVERLDAYEADALAVAAARENLADPRARVVWHDVAAGLPEAGYDWIVANPPFHDARAADPGVGLAFIAAAAAALAPGGSLALVANRTLPYEAALGARFAAVERVAERDGYKVLLARR